MIDFIYKLSDVLPVWSPGAPLTLKQISDATDTSLPHVVQYLSEGLSKDLELGEVIPFDELTSACALLQKKFQAEIKEREELIEEQRQKAIKKYHILMSKTRSMLQDKKWHMAYRSLSYFAGQYEIDLPRDILTTLCSDIIHIGVKAKGNIQELGYWFQKGIAVAISHKNREGIEEALDLINTYGEFFLSDTSGKGSLILSNILAALEEPCARFELWEEFKNIVIELYP
jgi:hypothetical protein